MMVLARFARRPLNALAVLVVLEFVFVAILAPVLAPPPEAAHPSAFKVVGNPHDAKPKPPSVDAPLGTAADQLDIYYTLIWGTRSALIFGVIVAGMAAAIGTAVGSLSGYVGGGVDAVLMRACDAWMSVPVLAGVWLMGQLILPVSSIVLAQEMLGAETTPVQRLAVEFAISPLMVGLVLFMWMPYARLINSNVRVIRESDFVMAARALGVGHGRILTRHIIPNAIAPVIVLLARDIGGVVVLGAAFTFVGVQGGPEWGVLLVLSRTWILGLPGNPFVYWWVFFWPTMALVVFNTAFNLIGDGLNSALNPQTALD